jgi:hypothetical protein
VYTAANQGSFSAYHFLLGIAVQLIKVAVFVKLGMDK